MSFLPKIELITNEIIETLKEEKFFDDYEIEDTSYAKRRIGEELTKKFLIDGLDNEDGEYFTEDEFDKILREIAAEDVLRMLQRKGFLNSYEDENTEETFFLTEKGKEELKKEDGEGILNIFKEDED